MKILCVADHVDPLVYSTNAKDRFKDIDLVLAAGDIPMTYLEFIASTLNRDVYFVFGNHNLKFFGRYKKVKNTLSDFPLPNHEKLIKNYFGSTYIGDKVSSTKGLLIAGLGGSIRYNYGENQYTDFQMFLKMLRLIPRLIINKILYGRYLDILLTHSPPHKLNDRDDIPHRGFKAFRTFMKFFKPRYLLHGHIHLYDPNEKRDIYFHDTQIINVYGHFILDLAGHEHE